MIGPVGGVSLSLYLGMGLTAPPTQGIEERWLPEEGILGRMEQWTSTLVRGEHLVNRGHRRCFRSINGLLVLTINLLHLLVAYVFTELLL